MTRPAVLAECARLASGSSGAGAGALASIARRRGSLPMSATAKLLITASGARIGTVGGGCLEAEVIERAMDVLERRVPALSTHSLNNELAGDYGLTCGGTAEIFIEPVFPDPILARAYDEANALIARGDRGVMVTAMEWANGPRKLAIAAGGEAAEAARAKRPQGGGSIAARELREDDLSNEALTEAAGALDPFAVEPLFTNGYLVEPIVGRPRVVIFGAGHVGARVGEAAAFAGWHVTIVDDRADFADPSRLPFADRVVTCEFHDVLSATRFDPDTYVVIATRGHQHDAVIAAQVAPRHLRYIGMLGSRRKAALTAKQLRDWDVTEESVSRIRAPIGVSIGADTPEEIAVSVVAEMIAVRRASSSRRGGIDGVLAANAAGATEMADGAGKASA
jgi:xanthine dehydrogenase accessory factor